jgi:hypothetical protein
MRAGPDQCELEASVKFGLKVAVESGQLAALVVEAKRTWKLHSNGPVRVLLNLLAEAPESYGASHQMAILAHRVVVCG